MTGDWYIAVVRFRILGPLRVVDDDGRPVEVTGARRQAILGILLLRAPRPVSPDQLAYARWGDTPPATARRQNLRARHG